MTDGLTAADVLALTQNKGTDPAVAALMARDDRCEDGIWNNPFIYLVWIMVFGMMSNGSFGGWGNNNAAAQGALTRADLCQEMNFGQLENTARSTQFGLSDGFYAMNTGLLNGFNGVQRDMCSGFSGVNSAVTNLGYQMKDCCCGIRNDITALSGENFRNTCEITNAIHCEGEQTRALINSNTMQALRDKLEDKDRALLGAQFQISQQQQNSYLINQLKPCAIPAYITSSPYATSNGCGCGL
jgi:hypothetical protein